MYRFFDLLQLFGGILLTVGYIPQVLKILRTRDVESFALPSFLTVAIGIGCMQAYATYQWFGLGVAGAFMVTNTLSFLIALLMVGLIIRFRKKA